MPCPLPTEVTNLPVTDKHAPVEICLSNSSSKLATSATIWILCTIDPSLRAINATFLLPRLVLTQPFTFTVLFNPIFSVSHPGLLTSLRNSADFPQIHGFAEQIFSLGKDFAAFLL